MWAWFSLLFPTRQTHTQWPQVDWRSLLRRSAGGRLILSQIFCYSLDLFRCFHLLADDAPKVVRNGYIILSVLFLFVWGWAQLKVARVFQNLRKNSWLLNRTTHVVHTVVDNEDLNTIKYKIKWCKQTIRISIFCLVEKKEKKERREVSCRLSCSTCSKKHCENVRCAMR